MDCQILISMIIPVMSGNRFVCGMRKYDQHKQFSADRPANPELFQQQQKSLQDLIALREQQDAGQYTPLQAIPSLQHITPSSSIASTTYTPWKTPPTN
jgi:hypothetical protein